MTPIRLSHIWYRRLYLAVALTSLGYTALYGAAEAELITLPAHVQIPLIIAVLGGATAIVAGVLAFLAKKIQSTTPALLLYLLFAATTTYLVYSTGGVASMFLPIWALVALAAPLFGAIGWLSIAVVIAIYLAVSYINGGIGAVHLLTIIFGGAAPLIAGIVMFHTIPGSDELISKDVKSLATQLSEVANKSEIVINAIGDGVVAVDGKGIIQLINPAAQKILGWGKQDALLLHYKSILKLTDDANKELDPAHDPIDQVLNTNQQARNNKLTATTNSGKKLSVALVVSPIGETGAGAIAVFRDITNERAEEREQAEFISTASHEMRTPVASIEGYLGLALNPQTATIDEKARDFILKAHEAAQHLGRLFQDLLDVSKSEDGRLQNNPKVLDVVPFTNTIIQGLTAKANEKGLQLIFKPQAAAGTQKRIMPVYFVNLDNDHLREVLDNLIENGIKYTPSGSVTVDINGDEDHVTISITDTGLGIPSEDIPHLFQKFYRVENVDRQSIGGTGLGLYLCRRLVEAMQGRMWVESEFQKGSTFFVELPRLSTQDAQHLQTEQAAQAEQQARMTVPQPLPPQAPTIATAPNTPVAMGAPMTTPQPPTQVQQMPQQQVQPVAPTQQAAIPANDVAVKPATTVPRGESLSREQIQARVRQLEEMARQQREQVGPPR